MTPTNMKITCRVCGALVSVERMSADTFWLNFHPAGGRKRELDCRASLSMITIDDVMRHAEHRLWEVQRMLRERIEDESA